MLKEIKKEMKKELKSKQEENASYESLITLEFRLLLKLLKSSKSHY